MKKYILLIMLVFSISTFAQQYQTYRASSFAAAKINQYTHKYQWSEWKPCDVNITFDVVNKIIHINSSTPQTYVIISSGTDYTDNSGGEQIQFKIIDQDNDRGTLRLRRETNGNIQLYIDFSNVGWCYNIYKIN